MNRVTLGDVAKERRETCKGDKSRYPVVGLEHLTPEEITLTAWDDSGENTFTKMFHKGDMLFGRRRAYLKKAAVAPFDGICSSDITVIEAKPDSILPELLPFVIQNDAFFDFAVEKSAGSLSPRAKWEHLKDYEFNLSSMDEQRKLARVLWAINDTIEAYKKLIAATDELVKAQFVEMFGGTQSENDRITFSLQSLIDKGWITYHLDGNHGGDYPRNDEFIEAGVPYISANCIERGRISFTNAKYVTQERAQRFRKGIAKSRDVLFAHNATVGPVALLETQEPIVILGTSLTAYRCDEKYIMPEYLKAYMENTAFICQYESDMQQTTRKQVPITTQRRYRFIIPSMNKQNQFVTFVQQADKSKFELERALTAAKAVMKGIVEEKLN